MIVFIIFILVLFFFWCNSIKNILVGALLRWYIPAQDELMKEVKADDVKLRNFIANTGCDQFFRGVFWFMALTIVFVSIISAACEGNINFGDGKFDIKIEHNVQPEAVDSSLVNLNDIA